jgi:hypothetical protein
MIFLRLEKNIENIEIINTYYQFLFLTLHDNLLTDGALSSGHPLAGIGGNPGHP